MAARTFQLITVGSQLIEGVGIQRGEPAAGARVSHVVPASDSDPLVHLLQQLDQQLHEANFKVAPLVLVFPTSELTIRRLEFPFDDRKKIAQALVFELENELLDDVGAFLYEYAVVPRGDGSAEVLTYLVSRDYLQAILNVCQARNLVPVKATFSAHALSLTHPPDSQRHYYLYCGAEETYVACFAQGRLVAAMNFPVDLDSLRLKLGEGAPETREALFRAVLDGAAANGAGVREGLREELAAVCRQAMQFIVPHGMGEEFSLSLHGRFAAQMAWDPDSGTLTLPEQTPAAKEMAGEPRFLGAIEEYLADPERVGKPGGINFHHRSAGWIGQVKEYKSPLLVTAVLLLAVLGFFLFSAALRISAAQARLERVDAEVQAIFKRHLKGAHSASGGVRLMEAKLKKTARNGTTASFEENTFETMELLKAVSGVFKDFPQLSLRSLSLNAERLTLDGTTNSYDASESLKNRLAQLKQLKGKEPVVTHQRQAERITFRLVVSR